MERKKNDGFEDIFSNSDIGGDYEDVYSTDGGGRKGGNDIYSGRSKTPVSAYDQSVDDVFASIPQYKREQPKEPDYLQGFGEYTGVPVKQNPNNNRARDVYMSRRAEPVYDDDIEFDEDFEYEDVDSAKKPPKKPKKKKSAGKKFAAVIAVLLVIVTVVGVGVNAFLDKLLSGIDYDEDGKKANVYIDEASLRQSKDVTNILLLGVDRRTKDEASRADTMMLLSIDKQNKKLKLTSFLRDSYVDIPGEGYAKLNAACTYGGSQLVVDTIEYNFKIKIDNYVYVDFEMFSQIVDKLGGVDVEVTKKEADFMASGKHGAPETPVNLTEGVNTLDGYSALWYCRIRYLDSDFFRTQRQRKVVASMVNKAKQTSVSDLITIVEEVMPLVQTGFTKSELKKIALGAVGYLNYDIEQQQIPAEGTWKSSTTKSGAYILSFDIDENANLLYDFIYAKDAKEDSTETTKG